MKVLLLLLHVKSLIYEQYQNVQIISHHIPGLAVTLITAGITC